MRIGFNAPSMQAYNALARSDKAMISSSARLSSGTKINSSVDNSAGLAISTNMKLQIDALNRAEKNTSNAVSLLQTAESGLGEIHSILQRMRELGVQAANDTNTDEDRSLIQLEIDELTNEIIDMTGKTEYNQIKLLQGGYQGDLLLTFHTGERKNYNMQINLPEISCSTLGIFTESTDPATYAEYQVLTSAYEVIANEYEELSTNWQLAKNDLVLAQNAVNEILQKKADWEAANDALADAEAVYGMYTPQYGAALSDLGAAEAAHGKASSQYVEALEKLESAERDYGKYTREYGAALQNLEGTYNYDYDGAKAAYDALLADRDTALAELADAESVYGKYTPQYETALAAFEGATNQYGIYTDEYGEALEKFTEAEKVHGQYSPEYFAAAKALKDAEDSHGKYTPEYNALKAAEASPGKYTSEYATAMQNLADAEENLDKYDLPAESSKKFLTEAYKELLRAEEAYTAAVDACTIAGYPIIPGSTTEQDTINTDLYDQATKQYIIDTRDKVPLDAVKDPAYLISRLDEALEKVSSYRAHIGAFVNRLEHTGSYLTASHTEASSSLSRIYDTDMALEMANFSRLQVLTQTATSIMSQANQMPQSVLQLLQ